MKIYNEAIKHLKKFPKTICFRVKKHSNVIEEYLNQDEEVLYVFCGQDNRSFYMIFNSCVVAVTNKRIIIGRKRLLWGYFITTVTPDLYNDLKVNKGLIWSNIEIDTVKENIYLSNIDPEAAIEIAKFITDFMLKEKKKYINK